MFNNYSYRKQCDLTNRTSLTTFDIEPKSFIVMRNIFLLLFLTFIVAKGFTQKNSSRLDLIIIEGNCYEVLNLLKSELKNDSLAVSYFKKEYIQITPIPQKISTQKPEELIAYYNRIENKKLRSIHKEHYYNRVLFNE